MGATYLLGTQAPHQCVSTASLMASSAPVLSMSVLPLACQVQPSHTIHVSVHSALQGTTFTQLSIYTGLPGIPITDNPCRYTPWLARYICIQPSHSIYIYTLACQVQSYTLHYPLGRQAGLDISQCISQLARYNLHSSVYSMTCQVGPA